MSAERYDELALFATVARERSFTRAAALLGMSQPALSRSIRQLEERLGVRLLSRTTRSVLATEAGEHLLQIIAPRFEEIDAELAQLSAFRDKPAGTLRITAGEHSAVAVLQPVLEKLLPDHPDLKIEIIVDYGLTDIVAEGYDAGVRLGEQVAKDMIAVRIGPDMRMAVVGSPGYFQRYPQPVQPSDLMQHNCIALRLDAVLKGLGLAYMPEDLVLEHVAQGRLVRVLEDWCETFSGYHLYYPSRRQASPAFTLLREALRYPK